MLADVFSFSRGLIITSFNSGLFSTGSRSASRTDKRPLSSYRTVPESFAASPLFVPSVTARQTKPVNVVSPLGGGVWPPPVMFPTRQATTPDPGKLEQLFEW